MSQGEFDQAAEHRRFLGLGFLAQCDEFAFGLDCDRVSDFDIGLLGNTSGAGRFSSFLVIVASIVILGLGLSDVAYSLR